MSHPFSPLALALAGLTLLVPAGAFAAWPTSPAVNVPVAVGHATLGPRTIIPDALGGTIAFTGNSPSPYGDAFVLGIRAYRLLANGTPDARWTAGGRFVCPAAHVGGTAAAAPDGQGGAFFTWMDIRSGEYKPYALHVLESGAVDPAWPDTGFAFCPSAVGPFTIKAASDGTGGLFVWWSDLRTAATDGVTIFLLRLRPDGTVSPGWPADGVAVAPGIQATQTCELVTDGNGGALLAWNWNNDWPMNTTLQHVLSSGAMDPAWPEGGAALLGDSTVVDSWPAITGDGAGGMLLAWVDNRTGESQRLYATRIDANGEAHAGWPAGGTLVLDGAQLPFTGGAGTQAPFVGGDGEGGIMVAWQDNRSNNGYDLYAAHVLSNGSLDARWPAGGRALMSLHLPPAYASVMPDGSGGAYFGWMDERSGVSADTYLQRLRADGSIAANWPVNGRLVCGGPGFHGDPRVMPNGLPGALVAWPDFRGGQRGAYAQRVGPDGLLGDPLAAIEESPAPSALALLAPLPNPASRVSALRFTLARPGAVRLDILDAAGRRVRTLESGTLAAGEHVARWDLLDSNGSLVRPGWYVARLEADGVRESRPLVVRR